MCRVPAPPSPGRGDHRGRPGPGRYGDRGGRPVTRRRNTAPPREEVLGAAMGMIAERGLEKLTMAALGREVG
ncbi:hypothetical protein ACWD7F_39345, partial [Streptomyces sp. NPDC005122]